MQEFFQSSVESAANVGVQVAVSGGLVVAVKSGWLKILQSTPAGQIANIAYIAMENVKCLFKFAKGEMTATETLDAMGKTNCSAIGGITGAIEGAAWGLALGPVGVFVGAVVGGIAGSAIGDAVYSGGKAIVKTAATVIESVYEDTKAFAKSAFNKVTLGLFA
jgi:phage tail tape-measure protein